MQYRRQIQLPNTLPVAASDYYKQESKKTNGGEVHVTRRRVGDTLHIDSVADTVTYEAYGTVRQRVTKHIELPAMVSYASLQSMVEVSEPQDEMYPWDEQDGWEHDLIDAPCYNALAFDKAHNFVYQGRRRCHVVVTDKSYGGESFGYRFASLRSRGASKQVAREAIADRDREYVTQIIQWYNHGYKTVDMEFKTKIAGKQYSAECCGYEDHPDAIADGKRGILYDVVHELEEDGFIVVDKPDAENMPYKTLQRHYRLESMRHYMREQDRK